MIADEIRARVRHDSYRTILDRVEWVQVPFPVYPYLPEEDCLDWKADRVPSSLIPRVPGHEGTLMIDRLPYQSTGFFFPGEPGAIIAIEARGKTDAEVMRLTHDAMRTAMPHIGPQPSWESPSVDGALIAHMLGLTPHDPGIVLQTFIYLIIRVDPRTARADPYAPRALWPVMAPIVDPEIGGPQLLAGLKLIHALNTASTLKINGLTIGSTEFLKDPAWWERLITARGATLPEVRDQWWLDTGTSRSRSRRRARS